MGNRFGIAVRQSAVAIVGLALAGVVAAAPISIVNFSFEDPALGDGGFNLGPVTGWEVSAGIGTGEASGAFNPTVGQLAQGPTDGVQVAYSNNNGLALAQTLTALLTANTQYTLMVDVQSRTDGFPEIGSTLELWTEFDLLASSSVGPIAGGSNALLTTSFFANSGDPHLGQALRIRLLAAGIQSEWDNVRLDATSQTPTAAPEPATLALLGVAFAGMGLARRRKPSR